MSSWPSATATPRASARSTGSATEPVCGSLTRPSPHLPGQVEQRVLAVGVVVPDRPRVAGHAPALEPVPAHRLGQHAGGVVAGVRGVVGEHRDPPSQPGGQRACPLDVGLLVGRRRLDPGDAADDVGAGRQRLLDQLGRTRVAKHAVLREGDHGHVDPAPELFPGGEHRPDADQPGRGVDVGERLHVQHAVALAVGQRLADVRGAASRRGSAASPRGRGRCRGPSRPCRRPCTPAARRRRSAAACAPCPGAGGRRRTAR